MELLIEVTHGVRNIRAKMNVQHNRKSSLILVSEFEDVRASFADSAPEFGQLGQCFSSHNSNRQFRDS